MKLLQFSRLTLDPYRRLVVQACLPLAVLMLAAFSPAVARAQASIEAFHWVDFHDPKDAPTVTWVTQALKAEKWTVIREIGVQWDSAVVFTSERKTPQSTPSSDAYTVWSVSLAKHDVQPLLHGVSPHILNWTVFGGPYQHVPELALVYSDCNACDAASIFFTTLYYNSADHAWRARWMRGDQGVALWSGGNVEGVTRTQVYGLLAEPTGRDVLATWSHFDYGSAKPAEDFVFEYSVDPATGLEQTQGLSGVHGDEMIARLCKADPGQIDPSLAEMARGQASEACQNRGNAKTKARPVRRPVTTPPANNHGQSSPPGGRPKAATNPK